ncbi:ribonucleotide-diphosphate reductase subunit beta [Candidatus Gracilibacteria bacterium]|nr:ribonucleotide-diphosphate reductase subunit beta [Candidatus Gracilibacteria bacterium]
MEIERIRKRSGEIENYNLDKIIRAAYKGLESVGNKDLKDAQRVAEKVDLFLKKECEEKDECVPSVEHIQDIVERVLMELGFYDAAKSYILYRESKIKERKRDIFKPRINLKPYEYPELYEYVDAIRHSYWLHTEFNFTSDIQDFKVNVSPSERNAIQNAMLAIAQIEVAVKTFWGNVYSRLQKPEIGSVGDTFAESEVRHMDAYSHLLEILGLNSDFERIKDIPAIMKRIEYLDEATRGAKVNTDKEYMKNILLFSLFIEHVSLFSQFLIIMSFNKYRNIFKGISNVVEATSKEEQIHGMFGIDVINIIRQEHPEWFDEEFIESIKKSCEASYEAEKTIVDWIFEEGELDFLPKKTVNEFIKNRLNNSLDSIGIERIFEVDNEELEKTDWFDDEIMSTKHGDFFVKRSVNYNKRAKSITSDDLF